MSKHVGVWIDHKNAIMIFQNGKEEVRKTVESKIERHVHGAGGTKSAVPYMHAGGAADDRRDRRWSEHLHSFYHEVGTYLQDAEAVWIMGPGEAKTELKHYLDHQGWGKAVTSVDPLDKMTENQLAAKVRDYFKKR